MQQVSYSSTASGWATANSPCVGFFLQMLWGQKLQKMIYNIAHRFMRNSHVLFQRLWQKMKSEKPCFI